MEKFLAPAPPDAGPEAGAGNPEEVPSAAAAADGEEEVTCFECEQKVPR